MRNPPQIWTGQNLLQDLMNDFDEMVTRAMEARAAGQEPARAWFKPNVDIEENEQGYLLSFDLPGVKKEEVKIEVTGRVLSVSGERKPETVAAENGFKRYERLHGHFERHFTLPVIADTDRIQAEYQDGVLRVAIPKTQKSQSHRVPIQVGRGRAGEEPRQALKDVSPKREPGDEGESQH